MYTNSDVMLGAGSWLRGAPPLVNDWVGLHSLALTTRRQLASGTLEFDVGR
jgi:hypothetical protein